ncbi:hypothetical protein J6590_055187 [Homalodisca vitripennis]|nr:hypothetical protein J6590_055187 [Homalodisca vitripennis]
MSDDLIKMTTKNTNRINNKQSIKIFPSSIEQQESRIRPVTILPRALVSQKAVPTVSGQSTAELVDSMSAVSSESAQHRTLTPRWSNAFYLLHPPWGSERIFVKIIDF